jgi:hypothetical protein
MAAAIALAFTSRLGAQGIHVTFGAWTTSVLLDTLQQKFDVKASPEKVYEAVLQTFPELGIPTGRTDGKAGIIGSERFERNRSLAGAPMSRWFYCGDGPAGPNANSYRLEIAVVAWISPAEGGTTVGIATIASGRDIAGTSRRSLPCTTTGALETKLIDKVKSRTGASS